MHLKTPDEGMTLDQKEISSTNIANKTPSPLITSNKPVLTEKEPRPVYISLRESKLSASAPAGPTYGKYFVTFFTSNHFEIYENIYIFDAFGNFCDRLNFFR